MEHTDDTVRIRLCTVMEIDGIKRWISELVVR